MKEEKRRQNEERSMKGDLWEKRQSIQRGEEESRTRVRRELIGERCWERSRKEARR